MRFLKLDHAAILAAAMAICAVPVLAQTTTQQQQTTTTTTTTASGPDRPLTAHQLKKDERADKAQAKADKSERKVATSHKMHKAEDKQAQADRAADHANSPY